MRIAVLGPLEVRRDTGDPVAVPGAKERLLVAVLAAHTGCLVTPTAWLREACAVVGRDLTRTEWDRYLPGWPWAPTCTVLD